MQALLRRFGYLSGGGTGGAQPGRLDDFTSRALALYQRRHSLPVSGAFDERTRTQMSLHRCGMADLHDGLAFATRGRWPSPQLTFAFEPDAKALAGPDALHAIRKAFGTWSAAVPITFTEVEPCEGPDVVIRWGMPGEPDQPTGGVVAQADYPPACGAAAANSTPRAIAFADTGHWSIGAAPDAFDVETVALHQIGHILGLPHSEVPGSVMFPSFDDNRTNRALSPDDLRRVKHLYPGAVLPNGVYAIRQRSTGRHLDADEMPAQDFRLVTRPAHDADSQRWQLTKIGTIFVIRHRSTGGFLEADDTGAHDFRLGTRASATNGAQQWIAMADGDGAVTLRQLSSLRFLHGHENGSHGFALVTCPGRGTDAQKWWIGRAGTRAYTIRQKSTGRFVDAWQTADGNVAVVTRPTLDTDTQRWIFAPVGAICTLAQRSSLRFVDGGAAGAGEGPLATRPARFGDTQRWIVMPSACGSFTIQQLSSGRFVGASGDAADDFCVVTRDAAREDAQRWMFDKV